MAGQNRSDMTSTMKTTSFYLRLLGSLDFSEVLEAAAGLLTEAFNPQSLAILVWDPDLETVSDTVFFGPKADLLKDAAKSFSEELEAGELKGASCGYYEADEDSEPGSRVLYLRLESNEKLCAAILLAGTSITPAELEEKAAQYPLYLALSNGWEIRELKRENERLRSRYDDLEDQNSNLEDQTRKLIQDLTVKDAIRFRTIERDKMLFEISALVRSTVQIQEVLQSAVNALGQRFDLNRCLILRPSAATLQLLVYEYHDKVTGSVAGQFFSQEGQEFVRALMTKTAPCDLGDQQLAEAHGFDPEYLKTFGFLSALIVPLIMRDRTIGSIFLQDCKTPRPWSIDDLTFFGALADQLSVAVENADLHEEKKLQAVTDGLTGISNRRNFNEALLREFERARRYAEPMSLAVVDLDYLKKINDTYGHVAGDDAIKAVASVLSTSSRSIDIAARYGGEEFCLLFPNTLLEEAVRIADRIRRLISEVELDGVGPISASIGVANFPLHASEPDELFKRADEALYKAKQLGRNRVYISDMPQSE